MKIKTVVLLLAAFATRRLTAAEVVAGTGRRDVSSALYQRSRIHGSGSLACFRVAVMRSKALPENRERSTLRLISYYTNYY